MGLKILPISSESHKQIHPGGFLAQDRPEMLPRAFSEASPAVRQALVGSEVEGQNVTFMFKKRLKRLPRGVRRRFQKVSKKEPKREGSQDRFFIDFGRVLEGLGKAKTGFSLKSGTHFDIFGSCNISSLLNPQNHRFWLRVGDQDGF